MKQIELLRKIVGTPNVFLTEKQREQAKTNLFKKIVSRDRKRMRKEQLKLDL